jgi:hypothetical protein
MTTEISIVMACASKPNVELDVLVRDMDDNKDGLYLR